MPVDVKRQDICKFLDVLVERLRAPFTLTEPPVQ
jgi:hypothetical protein